MSEPTQTLADIDRIIKACNGETAQREITAEFDGLVIMDAELLQAEGGAVLNIWTISPHPHRITSIIEQGNDYISALSDEDEEHRITFAPGNSVYLLKDVVAWTS